MISTLKQRVSSHWYQRPVAWAFMFLFLLISMISLVSVASLNKIENDYIRNTEIHVDKLRLLDEMVHYSRQRSVLLRDIVIAEDPFRQDEIIQKHGNLATRYLLARNTLSEKPLAPEEGALINKIIELNSQGYDLQQSILEHAVNGEREKALELVAGGLGPNREKIYPAMLEMRELLISASTKAAKDARNHMKSTKITVMWLYIGILALGIAIAWVAYRLDSRSLKQLNWQASHDELTGLLNRYRFESLLSDAIKLGAKGRKKAAVLYVDIDHFNFINNTSGHDAGDELLRQVAATIIDVCGKGAECGRIGGDQFAILLYGTEKEKAENVAGTLVQRVNKYPFIWPDRNHHVSLSVGIATTDEGGVNKAELLSAAYLSCDIAKENGGNRVELYQGSTEDTQRRREQLDSASSLKQAMEDDRLILFHQGIKSLHDDINYSEILLRMQSEGGDVVSAARFIPAAERYKLISDVDLYVVNKVLHYMAENPDDGCFSINLSGITLGQKKTASEIIDLIDHYGVDAESICFEVTETAAILNKTTAVRFMNILHGVGCHFALDDFGSGLSSFGYLRSLPIDVVKIDGQFIKNMGSDEANLSVIQAVNTIAHGFGLKTVAECVETQAQLDQLVEIGVDYVQGFHIEEPKRLNAA